MNLKVKKIYQHMYKKKYWKIIYNLQMYKMNNFKTSNNKMKKNNN